MKPNATTVCAIAALAMTASAANATLIADWRFNRSITPVTQGMYSWLGESGAYSSAFLISTFDSNTTFSTPTGNGSAYSLSADRWSTGDYAEIGVYGLPIGQHSFQLTWDQTRTSGGPSDFRVDLADSNGFVTTLPNSDYNVIQAGALLTGTTVWSNPGVQTEFTRTINFNANIVSAGNLYIRFVATGLNLGNGAARFDNISLTSSTVPAPGALALLGLAGLAGRRRR